MHSTWPAGTEPLYQPGKSLLWVQRVRGRAEPGEKVRKTTNDLNNYIIMYELV